MRHMLIAAAVFFAALSAAPAAHAAYMSPISDLIANSAPNTGTPHIITFKVHNAVPASGSISMTPEDGGYTLPGGFDFNDVDFAVANGGPFVERELASSPSAGFDGVSVSGDVVTITLDPGNPVPANATVRIILGTGATHQASGAHDPVNAAADGFYRVRVDTQNGVAHIDDAKAMFVVLEPVTTGLVVPYLAPNRFNGLPSGTLPAGSSIVELSLQSDKPAACRYATSSGVAYNSMTNTFNSIGGQLFYADVSGLQDNTSYTFYVRCTDAVVPTLFNIDDFPISFSLGATPSVTTSDGTTPNVQTAPAGAGGSGGVGDFPGGSAVLFLSSVTVSGKAPAGSSVTVLKDGKHEIDVQAAPDGSFSAKIPGLERGTYTFVTYATDAAQHKTSRFSSTISLGAGTSNSISNIVLSPTVGADAESVDVGQPIHVSGAGIPGSVVDLFVRTVSKDGTAGATPKEYTASSSAAGATPGAWDFTIPAKDLSRGTYQVQVKSVMASSTSELGAPVFIGYGEDPSQKNDTGNRSDINKDGKVNLVDFSILLTHWLSDDEDSDINSDGAVNLADFSIQLFNWTG